MFLKNSPLYLIILYPTLLLGQLSKKDCFNVELAKRSVFIAYARIDTIKNKTHFDSIKWKTLNQKRDSLKFIYYVYRYLNDDALTRVVVDSNGWHIPDSLAKNTRFGHLKDGESLDLYYMKPIVLFYDITWEQNLYYDMGGGRFPKGYRSLGPCKDTSSKSEYDRFALNCQCGEFYQWLAYVYDLPLETVQRLAQKGKDMRYIMYRRIQITKLECYYEVQFYKEIFEPDTKTEMLNWYVNKFRNKTSYGAFEPKWERAYLQNSTLTRNPLLNTKLFTSKLDNYSYKLCEMEKWKLGSKHLGIKSKYIKDPSIDKFWYHDYNFNKTWQIMDFGDGKPVCTRYDLLGDYIFYRNPVNRDYYDLHKMDFTYKQGNLSYFRSYDRHRRLMYYMILRYPWGIIMDRIDKVTE